MTVRRLAMEAFVDERRLTYHRAVSAPTSTLSAVLAGGGCAQVAMLLVLLRLLDRLGDAFQNGGVNICVYVDDIALYVTSTKSSVAASVAAASDQLVSELESTLSTVVSRRAPWATDGLAKRLGASDFLP